MGKIVISKEYDENFGNLVCVTNGIVELKATLDYGPRILAYNLVGMENMLFTDPSKSLELVSNSTLFGGNTLKIIGGHRIMISPEVMPRAYYPDSHPVELLEKENGISLTAPFEEINHIQKALHITLNEDDASVEVLQQIQNCGTWDLEFAVWGLTVMAQGGTEVLTHGERSETGFLPNRLLAVWDYTQVNDERFFLGNKYITLKQDPTMERPFKIGLNNEPGWAAYFNKNQLFIKYHKHELHGNYPDFGCSYETYTNNHILELETLGTINKVVPMGYATTIERWDLHKEGYIPSRDESEIEAVLSKYLEIPTEE